MRPQQAAQRHALDDTGRLEARIRPQFQGHPGEGFCDFVERQFADAEGRVVDGCRAQADFLQHHEVIEVPVQHSGQLELAQTSRSNLSGREASSSCSAIAVIARYHAETGQATFGSFGL